MPSRSPSRPRPLRWHLVWLVGGVLLPAVVFSGVLIVELAQSERAAVERRALHAARALSEAFDREMSGSIHTLKALAQSASLEEDALESFHAECLRVLRTQPHWRNVLLSTPEGTLRLSTGVPWGGALPPLVERESLERLVAARTPQVGSVERGPNGLLAFPVRVPVLRGGQLRYVLSAVVTSEALGEVVSRQASAELEWTRTLVDAHGTVAARTRRPERYVGRAVSPQFHSQTRAALEGVYPGTSLDGAPVYVAFSRTGLGDWTSAVVSPRQLLDAPLRRSLLALCGLGLGLLLLSGGGAWLFSRRMERALLAASGAAEALAQGQPVRLRPSRVEELARLGRALRHSGHLLEERERERDAHLAAAEAARAEAVAAAQAKDAFLALLGHELRNPLAPIVSSLEALRLRGQGQTQEHEVISRQLRHVVRMVDDLLDVARITRGQLALQREPVELSSVVAKACEAAGPLVEQRQHALRVDVPETGLAVLADPVRLVQVVANLLTNAARYTPPGGHLYVRARAHAAEVLLEVEDDGQGLTPELAARIWEPFVQGPRTFDQSAGGLGIGLALVRSLVQAHGGHVQVHSEGAGRGSTFRVGLPRLEAGAGAQPPAAPAPRSAQVAAPRLRILLVDDNVDAVDALAELLRLGGHEVAVAHDCAQALACASGFAPELAILDIGLPEVDGYGVAQRLREQLGERCPVFAALTGFGQGEDRARSGAEGFRRHFVKPVSLAELEAFFHELGPAARGAA